MEYLLLIVAIQLVGAWITQKREAADLPVEDTPGHVTFHPAEFELRDSWVVRGL